MAARNDSIITAFHLNSFHQFDRHFYNKTVMKLNQNHVTMKWVMALWLWMESIGHSGFIVKVAAFADEIIIEFVEEGIACIQRVNGPDHRLAWGEEKEALPLTNTLVAEPIDLRFFECHHDVAYAGISKMYDDVANVVFSDVNVVQPGEGKCAYRAGKRVVLIRPHPLREEGSTSRQQDVVISSSTLWGGAGRTDTNLWGNALGIWLSPAVEDTKAPSASSAPFLRSSLNPMAEPWTPVMTPEEQRSMFITFSRGYPLTREEIMDFFARRYGNNCVEAVMVERARPGSMPVYGRLVLTTATMIAVVLNGRQTAKFMIRGKHLWARMYVPRQNQVGG